MPNPLGIYDNINDPGIVASGTRFSAKLLRIFDRTHHHHLNSSERERLPVRLHFPERATTITCRFMILQVFLRSMPLAGVTAPSSGKSTEKKTDSFSSAMDLLSAAKRKQLRNSLQLDSDNWAIPRRPCTVGAIR
jgi:hypothetical protein